MNGSYNLSLVAVSVAIAIVASYTTLDLASRVSESAATPRKAWSWLIAGALSMGTGIWAMHFIGMLAFHLPIPIAYDIPTTILSMLVAVAVSATALFVLRMPQVSTGNWLTGAVLMGIGIASMHYTGMSAMRMFPSIRYDPTLFVASILIATLASVAALGIALRLRGLISGFAIAARLGSSVIMGAAISGMHYTGMAAARFAPGSFCRAARSPGLGNDTLGIVIGCVAMALLILTILLSTMDSHFAAQNLRLVDSLRRAKDSADAALRDNREITAELVSVQSRLLISARQAGMSEIAVNVLHNVGNVLNSVNICAEVIHTKTRDSKVDGLSQAVALMSENSADLGRFFSSNPKGQLLHGYLAKLSEALQGEKRSVLEEIRALMRSVGHIKDIVSTQQSYAGTAHLPEEVKIEESIDDALRISAAALPSENIAIVKDLAPLPPVVVDKHLILQILVNLITNAKQATAGAADKSPQITIKVAMANIAGHDRMRIEVADNGEGIQEQNLTRLFAHGFTTRKTGHGFGLHSSALAAKTMGGSLTARSAGPGQGAAFTLDLPMQVAA